jgi:hypothetical protein
MNIVNKQGPYLSGLERRKEGTAEQLPAQSPVASVNCIHTDTHTHTHIHTYMETQRE